ncbi:MAG: hypothetical protein IKN55_06745 [Oscillospiraceae bacterium]|nr:hypothetical protein [Oscillospiraceae bacterium]
MNERNEKLKAVLSDEAFVNTLLEAGSEEEVQKLLADKGVEMSAEEIRAAGTLLSKVADGQTDLSTLEKLQSDELDDDALELVAGGISGAEIGGMIEFGLACTFAVTAVATVGVGAYKWCRAMASGRW